MGVVVTTVTAGWLITSRAIIGGIFKPHQKDPTVKTILITGASTGIGRATVEHFHKRGWKVVATMRTPDKADWVPAQVQKLKLDVTDPASIREALEQVTTLDVLVNNAGYGLVGPFECSTSEQVKRQFDTNVFGLMDVTRAALPKLRQAKGVIINISSIGGRLTFPLYSLYHSTKWAVEGFTESLHYELKPLGVRVKLVEPGAIKTDFYDRSPEITKDPEVTAYDPYVNKVLPRLQGSGQSAPGPEAVARAIERAATDGSWKLRYPVNAAPLLWLRRLIPEDLFVHIVGRRLSQ